MAEEENEIKLADVLEFGVKAYVPYLMEMIDADDALAIEDKAKLLAQTNVVLHQLLILQAGVE